MTGKLYITATPIGNLEDITLRALRVLRQADIVAAEDTRHTLKLLNHYDIKARLFSYHEHNSQTAGRKLVEEMLAGKSVALVSDAGMPCISDPGYELVRLARAEGIEVTCLPGASAAVAAVALSGLRADRFVFEGFLARDGRARKNALEAIRSEKRAVLLYEAPHRLKETLADLAEYMPERNVAVIKDISKLYESVTTCALADAAEIFEGEIKGEYAILLEQQPEEDERAAAEWTSMPVEEHIRLYIDSGFSKMDAIKKVAKDRGMKKGEVYNLAYDIKNPSGQ